MQENMIYKESLPFVELIEKLRVLQTRINRVKWNQEKSFKGGFTLATLIHFIKDMFTLKRKGTNAKR
jgi:hypothetical protein